jgi:hypothetical protein
MAHLFTPALNTRSGWTVAAPMAEVLVRGRYTVFLLMDEQHMALLFGMPLNDGRTLSSCLAELSAPHLNGCHVLSYMYLAANGCKQTEAEAELTKPVRTPCQGGLG